MSDKAQSAQSALTAASLSATQGSTMTFNSPNNQPRWQRSSSKLTVDMTRYPASRYIRDNSLLSQMAAIPASPVPVPYSWANDATLYFLMILCDARWTGLVSPPRSPQIPKHERAAVWEHIRRRFCESGLYALVPGLTDSVLEQKYRSEFNHAFKPYKKLHHQQYLGQGFVMDVRGRFEAPDELWERHFAVKANQRDTWLRQKGMPLWALYEEALGEDVATGELALVAKQELKATWAKCARKNNTTITPFVGAAPNATQPRGQKMPSSTVASAPDVNVSRPLVDVTSEEPRVVKRRREAMTSTPDGQSQMKDVLQKVSHSTMDR